MTEIVIGSRGSNLALWQAQHVRKLLHRIDPAIETRIDIIRTTGDKITDVALAQIGGKGVFVKEIEEALLGGKIDLAVHSLKDVPTELPEGLELGAIPPREDPRDVLVGANPFKHLDELKDGAGVGTGSLRRQIQLKALRPDCYFEDVRGNVETRVRKMRDRGLEALILARAGLKRLGLLDLVAYNFTVDEMIPAVGQGALGIETRVGDEKLKPFLVALNDDLTQRCTQAERKFLTSMGGGCQVPMGAHAEVSDQGAIFRAFVAGTQSGKIIRARVRASADRLEEICTAVIEDILKQGAEELLEELE